MPRLLFYSLLCHLLPASVRLPSYLPVFVDYPEYDEVLAMYGVRFTYSEQQVLDRLPDPGALEAALKRPENHAYYDEGVDFARQAAILAHAISEGHCFSDGNKRLAYVVTVAFLLGHGFRISVSRIQFTTWLVMLSEPRRGERRGRWSIDDFDSKLRSHLTLCLKDLILERLGQAKDVTE